MRIAMVSTPFIAVPPPRYGGTELVVWELGEGLRAAGHEVVLFTTANSRASVEMRALYHAPVWPPDPYHEINHASWALGEVLANHRRFDVIHAHLPAMLPLARFAPVPLIYTIHHCREEPLTSLYAMITDAPSMGRVQLVTISDRQRALLPELSGVEMVHHGLDERRYPLGDGSDGHLVFLGRLAEEKGPHVAIDVAERARRRLLIAGQAHWKDQEYFQREMAPRLRTAFGRVHWLGEVGMPEKTQLLGGARALLFPIDWEEPFGLVLVESMFCGTPVIALGRGSVPEIIDQGVTGFICDTVEEMVQRVDDVGGLDRARCRAQAVRRFGRARMVRRYLEVYQHAVSGGVTRPMDHASTFAPRP